jgi:selenocysteine-specific elongation factor
VDPSAEGAPPLTVGTAGHVDHGKTALVRALTGIDTDRLAEERARGLSIVNGYAPLTLPGGRRLSLIDVPGHERLIRTMAAGASGIDFFLLAISADDGVMPQTLEHLRVLDALAVHDGVVAVTKADLADPGSALRAAAELLPEAERVACSARTREGIPELAAALGRLALRVPSRAAGAGAAVLHIDRVFSVKGAGTIVTGTLWRGTISRGDRLVLLPAGAEVRARSVEVHDLRVECAPAGQRVAVNLAGPARRAVAAGDVLAGTGAGLAVTRRLEVELRLREPLRERERVQLHHGARDAPARVRPIDGGRWRLSLERPLIAAVGDRLVLRRISPPGTLGGGVVTATEAPARRPDAGVTGAPPAARKHVSGPSVSERALQEQLRAAGLEPLDRQRQVIERILAAEGSITIARLRDELGTSRRYALALLRHFDDARVTRRLPDDRRVLRRPR